LDVADLLNITALPLTEVWNTSFDGIVLLNELGEIKSLNRSASRLFSSSPSSLVGTSIFEVIPSEEFQKAFQSGKDLTGLSISLGTQHFISNLTALPADHGLDGYLLTLKNMTQIQQLQQQLQQMNEARQLYDAILDYLEEGICAVDQQGKIIFYNRKMGEIHTLEPEAVRDKRVEDVWSVDEGTSTLLTALKTGRTLNQRETHFTNNGKAVTTLTRTTPLTIGTKKTGALEISKDVTGQKQLTETIHLLQNQLPPDASSVSQPIHPNNTRFQFEHIIYASRIMGQTIEQARRAARSNSSVLIVGETGTGKELFAQSIHNESPRKHHPFIAQNCAALPESLLEGILFGTTVGSFTGAVNRAGLFEQAHGGTLLLDEINSMSIDLQAKLLRVLQEKEVQRLGSSKLIGIDVRVIASINEDPLEAIQNNKLREDLYYRLGVVNLIISPLRNRKEDLPILIDYFINKHTGSLGVEVTGIDEDVLLFFMNYHWPGNVRQLEHTIEGALNLVYDETHITVDHLPPAIKSKIMQHTQQAASMDAPLLYTGNMPEQVELLERAMIQQALKQAKGNITKASEQLGISRQNLNYKLRKYHSLI
jgi:arginine utilization regulatory protein